MTTLHNLLLGGVASTALSVSCIAIANADVPGYAERGPAWTHTASSCEVDPKQVGKAYSSGADFSFLPNAFSDPAPGVRGFYLPLVARCNVLNPLDTDPANQNPSWNALIVGYADPDGVGPNTSVVAQLMRVRRDDGSISAIAAFNSDNYNVTARTEELVIFNQPMDFRHNEYYVELNLYRTPPASKNPIVYSVRLVNVSYCCN
jgi:hypothetical protein